VSYADRAVAGKQFLIDTTSATAATVGCTAPFTVTGDSSTWNIGIRIGGYYTRAATPGDAELTVSLPWATQFITGGGYLKLSGNTAGPYSAGTYAGDLGSKTNFGFNVKYNSKGTNLQGRVNIIIRRNGKIYQIKGNNLGSLGVSYCKTGTTLQCFSAPQAPCTTNGLATCPIKATFLTQANLTDLTNPLLPVSIPNGSGATLQMTMTDWGEPGSNVSTGGPDSMAITLTGKDGSLLYSANWQGGKSVEQLLDGGNLVVH
jgi:hypothetical protein